MEFEWDDKKATDTYRKRNIRFEEAKEVFADLNAVEQPNHFEGEERWQITGMTTNHVLLFVVFTSTNENGTEIIRIISVRRANRKERRKYELG